ncbi:hypothetical protein JCM10212_001347 [Sporobolomyces blumeae]
MTAQRSATNHAPQYHYALLHLTPTDPHATPPVDRTTFLAIVHSHVQDWFGTTGGVNPNEIDVVDLAPLARPPCAPSTDSPRNDDDDDADEKSERARRIWIRFPRSTSSKLLPVLPLLPSPSYRLDLVSDSTDLGRLTGIAANPKRGFDEWKHAVLALE